VPLFEPAMPGEYPQCTVVEWVRRSAQEHPEREAIVCNERRVSWRGFDRRVNQVANTLISRGIRRGDRVAILASASIEYVEVFMGCLRAGACLVPLSTMASTDALEKMVRDCSAKAFFLSNSMRELVWPFIHNLPELDETNRFAFDFTDPQWHDYQSVTDAASADDPLIAVDFTDLFNIIYSSGTTGVPKGITHNHMMRAVQMERVEQNGYADNARTLLSTPLYSNTTIVALLPTLVGAGTVVLMPKFDARGYLQLVQQEQCTHSMLVPVQYKRIMQIEDFDTFDLSSMRLKFGEICGRSPAMMNGYFGRDDLTEETLWRDSNGDTYFRSGDMGHMDEDGFLHLSDRKKDMIISGGLNIYANDLELALLEDPDIEDVAVIGVPSEQWGETPLGLVVLKKNCTRSLDAILTEANSRLGKSQRLSKLESREELPRSSIGKILKRELRGPYWEGA